MFIPPRCPKQDCFAHWKPEEVPDGFYLQKGAYHPKCRAVPVPRFKCRVCRRGFSRQTFRMDYCDNKPHLNPWLFRLLASGMGLRQSARVLSLSRRCLELKARKVSRHLKRLNRNLLDQFPADTVFSLDEMETYEGQRGVLPVTVPVLIDARTSYVVATDVATIKPSGAMSEERLAAIAKAEEASVRKREDRSRSALQRVFKWLRVFTKQVPALRLISDKKQLYGALLRHYFGDATVHTKISSKRKRDQANPLKDINLTNAMARDLNGRLRRESWLVSKHRRFLRLQLNVFAAYRNFVRRRINREPPTPAQILRFLRRRARFEDLLTWRQDWKWRSSHPLCAVGRSIERLRGRSAA